MTAQTTCFRVQCTVESQGSMEDLTFDIHKKRSGYLIYDSKNITLKLSYIHVRSTGIQLKVSNFHDRDSLDLCNSISK